DLRWSGGRSKYISKSNCCPPNTVRTIAEVSNYMYSVGDDGLYINMYGGNTVSTKLKDGSVIKLEQVSNYPWDGKIVFIIKEAPSKKLGLHFRIPGWCSKYQFTVNGQVPTAVNSSVDHSGYKYYSKEWKAGDKIELILDMPATLLESNPLVEETKNQVTVKRGPIVYCLESADLPGQNLFNVAIPSSIKLQPLAMKINNGEVTALTGEARLLDSRSWDKTLYRQVNTKMKPVKIKLIPYYAWAN